LTAEDVLHVLILLLSLIAAAAMAVVVLGPLLFEAPPAGALPWALGAGVLAVILVTLEWLGVHHGLG
jgi:hypothetical protein